MNAQKKKLIYKISAVAVGSLLMASPVGLVSAMAQEPDDAAAETEIIYYDDLYRDSAYEGQGTHTSIVYDIPCDEVVTEALAAHPSAPSYGNGNASLTNTCGPTAGTNIVVFYDRWSTNLIPDFDPGMICSGVEYNYYPDISWDQTRSLLENLYNLMKVPEVGGTTSANFKSGLSTYVSNQGYSLSYTSCYSSTTMVDLAKLKAAIDADKVALVMCSEYNFIYCIDDLSDSENRVNFTQVNSTVGHMMMVYGYKTLAYYTDGVKTGEDTFLLVSSGFSTGDQGYMRLNAFSVIDEAWVMTIS